VCKCAVRGSVQQSRLLAHQTLPLMNAYGAGCRQVFDRRSTKKNVAEREGEGVREEVLAGATAVEGGDLELGETYAGYGDGGYEGEVLRRGSG